MSKFYQFVFILSILWLITTSGYVPVKASESARPEVRALWVDAFRDGAKTPAQIDQLIADSLKANINMLIVQVRRRGDSYYSRSIEPRTEDPGLPAGFDALQYLIDKAHANKIEVHAWLNTLVAWNSSIPPKDPNHVWNLHGPGTTDKANWVSYYRTYNKSEGNCLDELHSSYYLDPGHPDALDYTVAVYLNVVKNYDVDGIHLDYSRYADFNYGYNPTSIARYNLQFGTTGRPAADDPQWAQWRRVQTANLVRKIYLKAIAVKPNLKVSSAVITWGDGPVTESDWEKSRAYAQVFQDWRSWLAEGIIDMAIPMNYFYEGNPSEQLRFNQWIEWEKDHQYGRQIIIGPGIFMQYIEQSLEQIRRAQAPSALGNYAAGVSLFAYGASHLYSNNDYNEPAAFKKPSQQIYVFIPETNSWLFGCLAQKSDYLDPVSKTDISTQPVFPSQTEIPNMPWKSHPINGYLMGTVSGLNGKTCDHLKVAVDGPGKIHREVYTDGNGWYGLAELPPGNYRITIASQGWAAKNGEAMVKPGLVSEVNL